MFPASFFSSSQILVLICLIFSIIKISDLSNIQNGNPSEWFRVRRQPDNGQIVHTYQSPSKSKQGYIPEDENFPHENIEIINDDDELYPEPPRQRRLYAPPVYVSEPIRRQPETRDGDQCKCDLEYVLKYRSAYPRDSRQGSYHVKVYHEETGSFHPDINGDTGGDGRYPQQYQQNTRKPFAYPESSGRPPKQQQQQPVRYYVEHVEDQGDRHRDVYTRGGGKPRGEVIRNADERVYNSRSRVVKSVPSRKIAKVTRKILENSSWATLSTMSDGNSVYEGFPYTEACVIGIGKYGAPYMYLRSSTLSEHYNGDLEIPVATLTTSLSDYEMLAKCSKTDPRTVECASVTISGAIIPVTSTTEMEEASEILLTRYPKLLFNEDGHMAKLVIKNIVLTQYAEGGYAIKVNLFDYENAS